MARNYIEKRIIAAGIELSRRRIEQKGTPITADDLLDLKVKTFSPVLQGFYFFVGMAFVVFGIWVHTETRNMAYSLLPVLVGVGNCAYAVYGNPRTVRELGSDVDIMDLSAEIVRRFVDEMDRKRNGDAR